MLAFGRENLWWWLYPYTWLSSITLLPWLPDFPPQAFPTTISSSHPLDPSLCSQQQPAPWYCSTIPKLQLPAAAPSRGICVPVWGMYGCSKDCLTAIPFRPSQISCFTLSLKCFSSDADNCPSVGIGLLLQFPHPPKAGLVLLTLLFFLYFLHPTEFCVGLYIFSTGQALLSALSWCSACISVSQVVFLMYPWREM